MSNIERIFEHKIPGKRLGRHIDHEARRNAVPFSGELVPIVSTTWARQIPILDQGDVGSCTANAAVGAIGTLPDFAALPTTHPVLNESEALTLYSAEEVLLGDGPYPPNDDGGTGPAIAQVCQSAGLISNFNHFTDINSTLQALMVGPVIVGINWYTSFDTPDANGLVAIAPGATVRGGHEVLMRVVDVENQLLGLDNSWGTAFGVNGSFSMSIATYTTLLAQGGDTTAFVPLGPGPAPTMVTIPNLYGHSAGYAHNALVALGLVPTAAKGQMAFEKVIGTSPRAGTQVAKGSKVAILATFRLF